MGNSNFKRSIGTKSQKRFIFVSTEGRKTERIYLDALKTRREDPIQLIAIPNPKDKSRPDEVLWRLLRSTDEVKKGDERWILIDRDAWEEKLLDKVNQEARKNGVKVGLSNPCFELWLYLHIGDNRPFNDRHHCQRELAKIFKDYSKGEYDAKSLLRGVHKAIKRAKALDTEDANAWPRNQSTRVYLMVEKLLPNRSRKSLK